MYLCGICALLTCCSVSCLPDAIDGFVLEILMGRLAQDLTLAVLRLLGTYRTWNEMENWALTFMCFFGQEKQSSDSCGWHRDVWCVCFSLHLWQIWGLIMNSFASFIWSPAPPVVLGCHKVCLLSSWIAWWTWNPWRSWQQRGRKAGAEVAADGACRLHLCCLLAYSVFSWPGDLGLVLQPGLLI